MAKSSERSFSLPSLDDLFTTQAEREEARLEKVVLLSPEEISEFPCHPFQVRMDAAMEEMVRSVRENGVLVPALVRPKEGGGYEMVSGHRRRKAAQLAGLSQLPCIVRELTQDQAVVIMVDSNLQREQILPSEKAFAYKMKLDAMKRQGQRTDLTCEPVAHKLNGVKSRELLAEQAGESKDQIRRYIRLTHLVPPLLALVDNAVLKEPGKPQMALRPAVELSYLRKEEQLDLAQLIQELESTPSHAQALKLRKLSEEQEPEGRLARDAILAILEEEKPNQVEQVKIPRDRISKFFPAGTPAGKMEETIVKALELYRRRQRDRER